MTILRAARVVGLFAFAADAFAADGFAGGADGFVADTDALAATTGAAAGFAADTDALAATTGAAAGFTRTRVRRGTTGLANTANISSLDELLNGTFFAFRVAELLLDGER